MSQNLEFSGFSEQTVKFFAQLTMNNDKRWFEANRSLFDEYVTPEARAFVLDMGQRLKELSSGIVAIPKTDKSIFRIYRDIRFSPDKSPYKTHLGILFWEGPLKKLENSGFYFQLSPRKIFFGVGMHIFSPPVLEVYRNIVVDPVKGNSLKQLLDKVNKDGKYQLGWKKYKKVPRGFDADHKNADLLLHGGLGFSFEDDHPPELHSPAMLDYCFTVFEELFPIHLWLRDMLYSNF